LLWVLSRLIVSEAPPDRKAREFDGGKIEFVANRRSFWGVYGFIACFSCVIMSTVISGVRGQLDLVPTVLCMGFILLVLSAFPGTLTVTPDGVEQFYWLSKTRSIPWKEIRSIDVDKKRRRITVSGRSMKKIVHTRQLPEQDLFLAELGKHRPELLPADLRQNVATTA